MDCGELVSRYGKVFAHKRGFYVAANPIQPFEKQMHPETDERPNDETRCFDWLLAPYHKRIIIMIAYERTAL